MVRYFAMLALFSWFTGLAHAGTSEVTVLTEKWVKLHDPSPSTVFWSGACTVWFSQPGAGDPVPGFGATPETYVNIGARSTRSGDSPDSYTSGFSLALWVYAKCPAATSVKFTVVKP